MDDCDSHFHKLSILGPTISFLIQCAISSAFDINALFFGHAICSIPSSPTPQPSPLQLLFSLQPLLPSSPPPLSVYDFLSIIHHPSVCCFIASSGTHRHSLLGFFVSLCIMLLYPSMREHAIACLLIQTLASLPSNSDSDNPLASIVSLSLLPLLLILISSSASPSPSIHAHEYHAFQLCWHQSNDNLCSVKLGEYCSEYLMVKNPLKFLKSKIKL